MFWSAVETKGGALRKGKVVMAALLTLFVLVGTASAIRIRAGDIIAIGDGGFTPTTLPKHRDAPITLYGHGRLTTVSGRLPPILKTAVFEFDRHGHVETRGLPVCTVARLIATTVADARRNCRGTIVGKGFGTAIAKFPDQAPIPFSSPITVFNAPRKNGNYTVLGHGYAGVPVPATIIVPVEIERINKGVYGYRVRIRIPRLAGGYGIPVSARGRIGRKWTHKGKLLSYVNARCATGRLQARGEFVFEDGTLLKGTFAKRCRVRR
jgi:hypothetical protein